MKKAYLTAALLALAAPAWADWVTVSHSVDGTTHYIDSNTIQDEGNVRRVWELLRADGRDGQDSQGVGSRRTLSEYDCSGKRFRPLYVSTFAGRNANGKPIFAGSLADPEWYYVSLGTSAMDKLRFVCGNGLAAD